MSDHPSIEGLRNWRISATRGELIETIIELRRVNTLCLRVMLAAAQGNLIDEAMSLAEEQADIHESLVLLTTRLGVQEGA